MFTNESKDKKLTPEEFNQRLRDMIIVRQEQDRQLLMQYNGVSSRSIPEHETKLSKEEMNRKIQAMIAEREEQNRRLLAKNFQ